MITHNDMARLDCADMNDTDGDKGGSVYLDAHSGDPA